MLQHIMTLNQSITALREHSGDEATINFLLVQLAAAVDQMPRTRQKTFMAQVQRMVGDQVTVTVRNCLTGQPVEIRWDELGGPCDPSTERYHAM
jgi:hypothetical protein